MVKMYSNLVRRYVVVSLDRSGDDACIPQASFNLKTFSCKRNMSWSHLNVGCKMYDSYWIVRWKRIHPNLPLQIPLGHLIMG